MGKKILVLFTNVLFTLIIISSIFASDEGKKLFEEKCDKCHPLERALSKTKNEASWQRTVERMAKKIPGMIGKNDEPLIAKYLAGIVKTEKTKEDEKKEGVEDPDFKFKKVKVEQFINPEVCADCHSEIFKQWKGSMHSKAFVDPVWRAATKIFSKHASTLEQKLEMRSCVKCHTPLGFRSYSIFSPEDDYDKLEDLPAQGIFCNWCHNINEVKHLGDAGYEVDAGGGESDPSIMLGPFKDASSDFHPTKFSELHTKSDFCGLCHNVSHAANKLPIEQTYDEWKKSPYNTGNPETTVNCQDCHMRQKPGVPATGKTARPDNPCKAADEGPDRKHIWTHYFVGGNAIVPKLLGSEIHSQMAIERLINAADLEIIKDTTYNKNNKGQIKIKVTNSGAGHYLPTGLTEIRQMWLDIKVTDNNNKTIYRSGELDKDGEIDKDAVTYHTILGNENGEQVNNVALADRILMDHRIPPKGYVIEKYFFNIPSSAVSPLKIEVVLKYRSASPDILKLILGERAPELPIIDMARTTGKIEF